jgi:hypothetical protein
MGKLLITEPEETWIPLGPASDAALDVICTPECLSDEDCEDGDPCNGSESCVDGMCVRAITDCNANGIDDVCDIDHGTSADCQPNGIPDECDITSGTSQDCNANEVPDVCDLASGASGDCNGNETPDECDIASGASTDSNGDGVPDECQGEGIPAVSQWGLVILALVLLAGSKAYFRRRGLAAK